MRRRLMLAQNKENPWEKIDYLTFVALDGMAGITITAAQREYDTYSEYSPFQYRTTVNNTPEDDNWSTWQQVYQETTTLSFSGKLQLRANLRDFYQQTTGTPTFYTMSIKGYTGKYELAGTPASLIRSLNFEQITTLYARDLCDTIYYRGLFRGCKCLTQILNPKTFLPFIEIGDGACAYMFMECSSLINTPAFNAEINEAQCYTYMFRECTSLKNIYNLPYGTFYKQSCNGTFWGCSSLKKVPNFLAASLSESCYVNMFAYCRTLIKAPALPATTLAKGCYQNMFNNCTSLINAPALPATTLAKGCYQNMFNNCTSLINAPALPATTLAESCYQNMFNNCTSLVSVPALPATTLSPRCYYYMFYNCENLTNAPELLATTLADSCCYGMFYNCVNLITAPILLATTLKYYCYYYMFYNCSKLNYIKAMFTTSPSTNYTQNWVSGVSSTGTFVKNKNASWNSTGPNAIPTGWTVLTE